tara:strand:+ start:384 stop:605 length:222 start_codon:yes stop_codon:yes gene_type:complete
MSDENTKRRLEPGSWCEINTKLKDKQLLKIVGYRGEMIHCIDDEGRMTMLRPNSPKVSRIFEVKSDGRVVEGK